MGMTRLWPIQPHDLFKQDGQLVAQCIKWAIERRTQTLTRPSGTLSRVAGEGR